MQLFYRPPLAALGDIIPFHDGKAFRIFYLRNYRNNMDAEHHDSWDMLTTTDQLHFTSHDTGIDAATGSVVYDGNVYHMFATVFKSRPMRNCIIHATSPDLDRWSVTEDVLWPDGSIYEEVHFRDPFVFRCEEENNWWMLIAAREKGPTLRRACVGLYKSENLRDWRPCRPLYSPEDANCAYECPDYFHWGDWYYLVFSSYSDRFQTLYRMSRSPAGPWIAPERDTFDTRAFYAAKTASDGQKRYIYGWNPTREIDEHHFGPRADFGHDQYTWDWGGNMVVHELLQEKDGTLSVRPPESISSALTADRALDLRPLSGTWTRDGRSFSVNAGNGYAAALLGSLPDPCCFRCTVRFQGAPAQLGVALSVDDTFSEGYYAALEPGFCRLQYKTPLRCGKDARIFPFTVEQERPIRLAEEAPHRITVFRDGSVVVIYVDDQVALSTRACDLQGRQIGLFLEGGEAVFSDVSINTAEKEDGI